MQDDQEPGPSREFNTESPKSEREKHKELKHREDNKDSLIPIHFPDNFHEVESLYSFYNISDLYMNVDRDNWKNRKEFFFTTLTYILNLGNILRFPSAVILGGGGKFLCTYIITTLIVGNTMLAFEVVLGQCSVFKFLRTFGICPFFEGLTYSMAIYCLLMASYCNVLNTYTYLYLFPSWSSKPLDYSYCSISGSNCSLDSDKINSSPEHVYHLKHILVYEMKDSYEYVSETYLNWRNLGIILYLWALMAVVIMKGIRRIKWPFLMGSPIVCTVLLITLIATLVFEGAMDGLELMFAIRQGDYFSFREYMKVIEQIIIGFGMGMGPLIVHGSCSKFHSPAHTDCFILTVISLATSLISVSIVYGGLGIRALQRNTTVEDLIVEYINYDGNIYQHTLFTQVFSVLPNGISHVISFLFFLTLLLTGVLSLIWLTEIVVLVLYQFGSIKENYKIHANISVCGVCFVFGTILTIKGGNEAIYIIDKYLAGICLNFIVLCEFVAVVYCYGVFKYANDILFMLGFHPHIYYLIIHLITPVLLLINQIYFFYLFSTNDVDVHWKCLVIFLTVVILLPIFVVAGINSYKFYKQESCILVFFPRESYLEDSLTTIGEMYKIKNASKTVSFKEAPINIQ